MKKKSQLSAEEKSKDISAKTISAEKKQKISASNDLGKFLMQTDVFWRLVHTAEPLLDQHLSHDEQKVRLNRLILVLAEFEEIRPASLLYKCIKSHLPNTPYLQNDKRRHELIVIGKMLQPYGDQAEKLLDVIAFRKLRTLAYWPAQLQSLALNRELNHELARPSRHELSKLKKSILLEMQQHE